MQSSESGDVTEFEFESESEFFRIPLIFPKPKCDSVFVGFKCECCFSPMGCVIYMDISKLLLSACLLCEIS